MGKHGIASRGRVCLPGDMEPSVQADILLRRIENEVRRRPLTDRRMGHAWTLVPILPLVVGIALFVALIGLVVSSLANIQQSTNVSSGVADIFSLYVFAVIVVYAVVLLGSVAFYYLIDRRNRHFQRQQAFFASVPAYLLAVKDTKRHENIARLMDLSEDSNFEEQNRPASMWAILYIFATPIAGLIIAYSLTQDLRKHEERQSVYQQTLPSALEEAGFERPSISSSRYHNRDPILYVVLAAITAGLFWIYWFYTLLQDYNEHFIDQAIFEDQILSALKPMITCTACAGSIPQNVKFCPLCGAAQPISRTVPSNA
jgi:uncharacterized membrane protein